MYLYTAIFIDGSRVVQTKEDQLGLVDGPNQYRTQVLESGKKIALFIIKEQKIWNPTEVKVNLISGVITVNGVDLYYEEPVAEDKELYWQQNAIQTMAVKHNTKTGEIISQTPLPEQRTYFVGWKSKTRQQIIGVK